MAKYIIPLANGVYTSDSVPKTGTDNDNFSHQMAFTINGSPTIGTIEVKAKSIGSNIYESVPDGVISLAAPVTLLFQFMVAEYEFTIAGSDVSVGNIEITDLEIQE